VCAAAGRKKYGARKFAAMAAAGRKKAAKRNPGEAAMVKSYRDFHGRDPDVVIDVETVVDEPSELAGVAKLKKLIVASVDGKSSVTLDDFDGALLARDPGDPQLYIRGGNQAVPLKVFGIEQRAHRLEVLGAVTDIFYFTRKDHLAEGEGGKGVYHHRFGYVRKGDKIVRDPSKRIPMLIYDTRNKLLSFAGGSYDLPGVGIRG
jgi:hypothetical protein